MILVYFTVGSNSSGSAFVIAPNLGAKILSEYFTGSAAPILWSWSYSKIGCSTPLYSWSASLIGSAYLFLYISFCFWFNKLLTNLTSLHQHLQYRRMATKCVNVNIRLDYKCYYREYWLRVRLSSVDLFIKVACFVKKMI